LPTIKKNAKKSGAREEKYGGLGSKDTKSRKISRKAYFAKERRRN